MAHKPHLHFMCGKAGAGKSVLAKTLAHQHEAVLLCEDIWLARLFPDELATFDDYIKYARRIKHVIGPLVIGLLARQSVVLDFPANTVETRRWFRSIIDEAHCAHTLHYLNAANDLCLQRIAKRNVERPEGSHQIDEATFMHITSYFQAPVPQENFNVVLHQQSTIEYADASFQLKQGPAC